MTPEKLAKKFAIVGTASSGKSTLTAVYADRFRGNPDVVVLDEGARIFFQQNPQVVDQPVHIFPVQKRIQDFVLKREIEAHETKAGLIIADRSVIDPVILLRFFKPEEDSQQLLDRVSTWLPTYTNFLLLSPIGVPYEEDVFRQETTKQRLDIHNRYEEFLIENTLPYNNISGSLPERIEQINTIIVKNLTEKTIFTPHTKDPSIHNTIIK